MPRLVEHLEFGLRADQREEHAKFCTAELLEEAAEHVVVIDEVAPLLALELREGALKLQEEVVQLL